MTVEREALHGVQERFVRGVRDRPHHMQMAAVIEQLIHRQHAQRRDGGFLRRNNLVEHIPGYGFLRGEQPLQQRGVRQRQRGAQGQEHEHKHDNQRNRQLSFHSGLFSFHAGDDLPRQPGVLHKAGQPVIDSLLNIPLPIVLTHGAPSLPWPCAACPGLASAVPIPRTGTAPAVRRSPPCSCPGSNTG